MERVGRLTVLGSILLLWRLLLPIATDAQQPSGVIYACVGKYAGVTRIVNATDSCQSWETRVQWNVAGPSGPQGPAGSPGAAGSPGPPGPVGIPMPAEVSVICPGQTIAQALQTVSGRPLTITVNGTCTENLLITRDDVTLRGSSGSGTIAGADPALDTIRIDGAKRVVIENLTVTGSSTGGAAGIRGTHGAAFTVRNATIQGAAGVGVAAMYSSHATIDGNTIQSNGLAGIWVRYGSSAVITANGIRKNGEDGIGVFETSAARIGLTEAGLPAGNIIEENGNGYDGIQLANSSMGYVYGNTIRNNTGSGIGVYRQCVLRLLGGNIVQNNRTGVYVRASTLGAGLYDQTTPSDLISGHPASGIVAEENASLDLRGGITITGNGGAGGIFAQHGVRIMMRESFITNNNMSNPAPAGPPGGILLQLGSSIRFYNPSGSGVPSNFITGNAGYGLLCGGGESSYTGSASVNWGGNGSGDVSEGCTGF